MNYPEIRYLERLADLYPTIAAASTEVINMEAILNLPKGTEHFLTDIHGEDEAFAHVLKNGSGSVRRKVNEVFGNTLSQQDKRTLATLIYYPREKMDQILRVTEDKDEWYRITLYRLIEICKRAASKYTRSKVRKAMPPDFAYILEELITEKDDSVDKASYYNAIVNTIIHVGRGRECIIAMSQLIQRLVSRITQGHGCLDAARLYFHDLKVEILNGIAELVDLIDIITDLRIDVVLVTL